jgi:hypothetical protein
MRRLAIILILVVLGAAGAVVALASTDRGELARVQLRSIRDALEVYRAKTGEYPRDLSKLTVGLDIPILYEVPRDPWGGNYVLLRPRCLLSRGADKDMGTADDIALDCEAGLINQHVLLEAGLQGDHQRSDVYGRKIHFVHSGNVILAWSYGQDGQPDTRDDQMARISAAALRRN